MFLLRNIEECSFWSKIALTICLRVIGLVSSLVVSPFVSRFLRLALSRRPARRRYLGFYFAEVESLGLFRSLFGLLNFSGCKTQQFPRSAGLDDKHTIVRKEVNHLYF